MRVEQTDEFRDWIDNLKDLAGRARILMRVDRLIHGNPGSHRDLRHGVSELKVDVGPGYRVYYAKRGGDRSTQTKDIIRAIRLVQTYGE